MKILILSHMYPVPYNEVYGIFVHEQVKALKNKGVEVRVVSPVPWTPFPISQLKAKWRKYSKVPGKRIKDGIELYYPNYLVFPRNFFFASSGKRMYRGISDTVREIYNNFKFDLIHAHVALPDGFAGMLLADDFLKPLVVNIHGVDAYVTLDMNKACKNNIIKVFKKSERIIPVSHKLERVLAEKVGDWIEGKSRIIGNGINPSKVLINRDVQEGIKRNIVLSVGNLIPRKAHEYVIKALKKITRQTNHEPHYLIIGKGPERDTLEKLVKRLNLGDCVKFLGRLSHEEVMRYMAKSDFFALPSWDEAFGVVYIEAMAHGKPVIACKNEGIDGILEDGKTGVLVEPKDVDSVFEALKFLLDNPKEAKKMGEEARDLVMKNYTWGKNAEKTRGLYDEVLNEKK